MPDLKDSNYQSQFNMKNMKPVDAKYNFQVTVTEGCHNFHYQPAKVKLIAKIFNCAMIAVCAFVLVSMSALVDAPFAKLLFIIASGTALWGGYHLLFGMRKPGSFRVTPTAFEIGDRQYDRQQVSLLFIKNPHDSHTGDVSRHSMVIIGGGRGVTGGLMAGTAMATGVMHRLASEVGEANAREGRRVNYCVCFRYAETDVVLAKHLSEYTAYSMLNKLVEITNIRAH